ncbi:hypothetical protein BDA99DRAFT_521323 [Phascolomyces articulosus]|uniref:histidine kinase n=1 Tax=Phascolomyces articulosus TaxID=60185 RepID=A0AAD5JSL8_9FUNG|nr:hypothetical protein BDA99DRAFT_521323 [Phascolomyces articulosus]
MHTNKKKMSHCSESGSSKSNSVGFRNVNSTFHIQGYRFTADVITSFSNGENIDVVQGYRIKNKSPVIARVSANSLRLEREYYIMKKLYQYKGGELYIVRPLEFIRLPSGLTVAIYASEGHHHQYQQIDNNNNGSDYLYGEDSTINDVRAWIGQKSKSNNLRGGDHYSISSNGGTNLSWPVLNRSTSYYYELERFLRFAIKCLDIIDFIHRFRMVHGEIRISSFEYGGESDASIKLCNFGSGSKSFESYLTAEGFRKTLNNKEFIGILRGVLMYMSPEQTGRTTYTPDHRTDIYSLGIVFFVILTGQSPFEGSPLETLNGILSRKIALVHELQPQVPNVISRIIEKMTNKAPDDRYTSARGVRADMKECLRRLTAKKYSVCTEFIETFPLAQKDIASVFTLPKNIYGRQSVIAEITNIINRCAYMHRPTRRRNNGGEYYMESTHSLLEHSSETEGSNITDPPLRSTGYTTNASTTTQGFTTTTMTTLLDGSMTEVPSISNRIFTNSSKMGTIIVGLYGPGGIGKSTVYTAVQPAARQNGYVASTKFDARNKVPYSAVTAALSQILQQVLSENEDEVETFHTHLKEYLGAQFCNIHVMASFVPELKSLLQESITETTGVIDSEAVRMDNIETQARFQKVYVEVFRAITNWRTVTLFFDDLHQADLPSLELIEALVMARVKILIFISYRDQEMGPKLIELLKNKLAEVRLIKIEPLDKNSIADFICDTLHRSRETDRETIIPLANVIARKTQCNAFYAVQLLRTLERKKLIFFNWEKNEWDFDLAAVEEATMFDDDNNSHLSVSFMVERLRELPLAGQDLLKWASFIGDEFSWETVKALMTSTDDDDTEDGTGSSEQQQQQLLKDDDSSTVSTADDLSATNTVSSSSSNVISSRGQCGSNQYICSTNYATTMYQISPTGSDYNPISGLQAVLQEGYIVPISANEFKWSHDRISAAAAELADPGTLETIHLKVAQHLMKEDPVDTFLVADHLLKCIDLAIVQEDNQRYRQIFIDSATKGQAAGAHGMAFAYYMAAIKLSDPYREWSGESYHTMLLLHTNAVALSWVVGEYSTTELLLEIIFAKCHDPLDRVQAYRVQAKYLYNIQKQEQGKNVLLRCLDELGREKERLDASEAGLLREFRQAELTIRRLGVDGILKMKTCEDTTLKATMGVIEELLVICYFGGQMSELFYWACRVLNIASRYGPTSVIGSACLITGLGYANLYKKYKFAEEVGSLGVALADRLGSNQEKGRAYHIYAAYVLLWKYHLREANKYFRDAVEYCLSAGDNIYMVFNRMHISILLFAQGDDMAATARETQSTYDEIQLWSPTVENKCYTMAILRATKALQGHTYTDTPNVFDGDDGFNDFHFITESCENSYSPDIMLNWYESYKMVPLTLYGHLEEAIKIGYRSIATIYGHPSYRHTRMMLNFFSLALIERARQDPSTYQECIDQVKKNQELVHEWAVHSPINYSMFWTFIQAELAGLSEPANISKAGRLYEESINLARQGSWYLDLCVIHEYTGGFYERIGFYNTAYGYIRKAVDLYMKHGAYGKGQQLSNKFAKLLSDFDDDKIESQAIAVQTDPLPYHGSHEWSPSSSSNASRTATNEPLVVCESSLTPSTCEQTLMNLDIIDMASILKSSHLISSEVQFNSLLSSMMGIILDVSAADCVAIVVKDDKYGVCAYGTQQDYSTTYDPPKPLSEDDNLVSSRIINHTIHTGESIFVNDVEKDTRFAVGPWFERVKRKSVVCMPIIHKVNTMGCLFIEGVVGIFTQRHIAVLRLLCQQMGISVTNAFLFKSIQRVTQANSRMIEMQKQALEEARRSKEEADKATRLREIFLANMSHEIRTPFSGFYGMISLLADTKLDPEQRDLVQTAKQSCEMLLQLIDDLLNFSKLQANKVSLDVAPVAVDDLLADVIEMLIALAINKHINISYSVAPDVPAVILADGNRIRQIIINLLGNALKFTHDGEVKIRCSLEKRSLSRDGKISLLFEVIDSGIGINEEQRKVLFMPFSQVDGSTTRKYGGTGLGLSICMQLVTLMSGKIDVDSVPNEGSNFHFNVITSRVHAQANKREEMITELLKELDGAQILVAAPYESTVKMIRQLLPGISIDGAYTASDLVGRRASNYHVIIVGIWMTANGSKDTEGWEEQLEQFLKDTRCVVVMHYPSGAVGDLPSIMKNLPETTNSDNISNSSCSSSSNKTQCRNARIKKNPSSGTALRSNINGNSNIIKLPGRSKPGSVVRISVPLRRITLLKSLVNILHQSSDEYNADTIMTNIKRSTPPSTPRPSSIVTTTRMVEPGKKPTDDMVTTEERTLYNTQNLLVAEDNPVAQKLLYKQLTRLGFKVVCANNGLEAIEAWKQRPPNYFRMGFFDHHMPKCDGMAATKKIRGIEKEEKRQKLFPIVALTADIQESTRQTCLSMGMNGYLTKPVNKRLLIETIRRFCYDNRGS